MTSLQARVLAWYRIHGRAQLPWRVTRNPYYTLVSEFMLQQTQVDRVMTKFTEFMQVFPSIQELAVAARGDVIRLWSGLGYNSRAVRLHALAREVVQTYAGVIPDNEAVLLSLPGVGPYTARAIMAFAFDHDVCASDTNVFRIMHRFYVGIEFPMQASRAALDEYASALVPHGKGHDWNGALMDIGTSICTARAAKCTICPLAAECVSAPINSAELAAARRGQRASRKVAIPFAQTTRFARGRIVHRLRALAPGEAVSLLDLKAELSPELPDEIANSLTAILQRLRKDGLVTIDASDRIALV